MIKPKDIVLYIWDGDFYKQVDVFLVLSIDNGVIYFSNKGIEKLETLYESHTDLDIVNVTRITEWRVL